MAEIRIGISGWTYAPWRGVFYPSGLPRTRELEHAGRQFDSIEINGSFYSLQRPTSYIKWREAVPDGFVYAVKAPRFITHMKKLKEVERPLANFLASGVLALGEKLGPILWQLPPVVKYDRERMEAFLAMLPGDTREAAELATRRDSWLKGRDLLETDRKRPIRHAIEVRNETFRDPEFFRMLRRRKVALVVSHSSEEWPYFEEQTADFVYARLHGEGELYSGGYGRKALDAWAAKIRGWNADPKLKGVYLYFDNDAKIRAPFDAQALRKRVLDLVEAPAARVA